MAIKDLFSKQKAQDLKLRGANQKSLDEFRQDVESGEEIKQIRIEDSLVIPDLNYASASNFVKYGSAKKYYADSIKRIYNQYPYDGSDAEKTAFRNEITQLERYILDVEYPKSTGFAVFSPDGWGTNTGPTFQGGFGRPDNAEYIQFKSQVVDNIYDVSAGRQGNLHLNWTSGSTFEFWMKKDGFPNSSTQTRDEVIFQISGSDGPGGHELELYIRRDSVNNMLQVNYFTYTSGTPTVKFNTPITLNKITTFADSTWHHYALTMKQTSTTNIEMNVYVDGEFDQKINQTVSSMPTAMSGSLIGTIGAFGSIYVGNGGVLGYGKLSASLDEFRFWKTERNAQQIGRNYFTVVNGGTNTDNNKYNDDNPVDLGVYFKFNEGKTGISATDSTVLDYSGRLSNGTWTGYVSNSRDTASAITQAGVGTESGDPIIYSTHPDVVTLSTNLEASGTQHDAANVGSLQNSIPLWMLDENQSQGGELENLLQIMGSYLDSLHLQITQISKFHQAEYQDNNNVAANPHNNRLLTSLGFDIPEMFIDKDVLETILNQDDKRKFEDKLNEIKNLVYKNIYNNLTYINKSKGTVKAIRNLLRCYGVDDDLFNFNVYANNAEYVLQDDYKNTSVKFDSLDLTPFADSQNSEGVIFNFAEAGNSNSAPYISGSTDDYVGFSVETNAIFPKTPPNYHDSIDLTEVAIVTASVFGVREANFTNQTTVTAPDAADISVRVVKNDNTAKFQLTSSMGVLLESDRFYDVYENSRWSLSTRIKYELDPFSDIGNGAGYKLEFNGYNYEQDILQNSFSLTASLSATDGAAFIAADKRIYAGAEKTNITGALSFKANMKLLSVLAWADYVEDDELKAHARDVTSFGRKEPYDNTFTFTPSFDSFYIPRFDTLAMNLAFNQVTSSDSSGEFTVPDLSSGSLDLVSKYGNYSKIVGFQNTAKGKGFAVSADVKDIQYLNIMTQQIPENLNTDNMIQVLANDDDLFFLDNRPVKYFFSLEASMYDTISREMLKTFAGVLDLASMIGSPLSEYQTFNKELRVARENFFSRVENEPSLEKYVSLYKFLDSAIEGTLFNLMPASADASDRVRTVIENHILERPGHKKHLYPGKSVAEGNDSKKKCNPKFENCGDGTGFEPKVPVTSVDVKDIEAQEANPNLPTSKTTNNSEIIDRTANIENSFDLRVERRDFQPYAIPLTQGAAEKANQYLNRYTNKRFTEANDTDGVNAWFAVVAERQEAGLVATTDGNAKTRRSVHRSLKNIKILDTGRVVVDADVESMVLYGSQRVNQNGNIILPIIQAERTGDIIVLTKVDQPIISPELAKSFADFSVSILNPNTDRKTIDPKQLPVRFTISGSGEFFPIGTGDASVIGHHLDTYYGDDLSNPAQGPFTEQHVGGYKHRHVQVGQTSARPELYKIEPAGSNEVKIFNPRQNADGTTYNMNIPRVKFSREELVKRHYNTRNIKTELGSEHAENTRPVLGNFNDNYEVVSTNGRKENNLAFRDQNGFNVTESESTSVSGVIDFALPNRALSNGEYNKTVIVNRFSSPGEVATLSEGYLDVEAAEYSPYNALPFRNREVVNNLNTFLQTPSAFGGYELGSTVTASFHKIQRNRVNRITFDSSAHIVPGSSFDNGFVINNIPRKDFGYWWISSSANPSLSMDGLYGFATSSAGITFDSGALRGINQSEFINFAGITTPASKIGESGFHYEINTDKNLLNAPTALTLQGTPYNQSASIYFLNINGPYGYPSFKQVRTGQHPVARFLRENNFVVASTEAGGVRIEHAPLSSKYKPILHNIKSQESIGGESAEKDILLKYTFANNYDFYGNYYDYSGSKLDNPYPRKHFENVDKRDSLFYALSNMYTRGNNAIKLNSMVYGETIYPKETNTYLSKARDRSRFVFNWRDASSNRTLTANLIPGSQTDTGTDYKYSIWPMDAQGTNARQRGELLNVEQRISTLLPSDSVHNVRFGRYHLSGSIKGVNNVTASSPLNTVQFGPSRDSAGQGPFDDSYSVWNGELRLIAKDHSIVPEYRISDNIVDIISAGYDLSNDAFQSLSLTGSQATDDNNVFLETFAHSDDIPAIEIVRKIQERDANRISINLSAAKKLLPYDGFYPVQRTLQLSTLFSQSLAPDATLTGAKATFQTLNNVIFSRLTYGSIRAGVAIDSTNWVSGAIINPADVDELQNSNKQGWNRIPFEAIIDPASYLTPDSLINENDHENFFASTASVGYIDPKYALAASNFYAGVVDTFVQNSTLTSIKSAPPSQWTFAASSSYTNYAMDVVISKQPNFTNHDDPSANGYPYFVHAAFYQPLNNGSLTWANAASTENTRANDLINPNASWSSNEATVTINFDYQTFKNIVTDRSPTLNDILYYSTKTYKNKGMVDDDLFSGFGYGNSSINSSSPFMTIEAGVDVYATNNEGQWSPTLRWECPTHNFVNVDSYYPDGTYGGNGTGASHSNRGIWHQFSTDTQSGLKLFARGPEAESSRTTGSLADALGFTREQKVVSQLATSTQLKEFLVVVPFVTNECQEETFFHYPIDQFERAYSNIDKENRASLSTMLATQRELILPPKLNYMARRDNAERRLEQDEYGAVLPPFAMYIFEISENLNQEDLSKWWQGVLPSAGTKVSMEKFNISHDIEEGQIISPSVLNNDLFEGKLPKEMRFKVFKAKYKRNFLYEQIKNKSINGIEPVNSIFGFNYPHDFYSLIEMAKVDLGLEYDKKETVQSLQSITATVDDTGVTTVGVSTLNNIQNALNLLSEDEDG